MVTSDNLVAIFGCSQELADRYVDGINITLGTYEIDTPLRAAAFLAQVGHESNRLKAVEENLNYGAKGLMGTFKKYFPTAEIANEYSRKPEAIANRTYANRYGNGDEASGDGWLYHGRGLIQITFKDNYAACGESLGEDFVSNPSALATPQFACLSAGWYWDSRKLNQHADEGDIVTITKRVNGGTNGLDDRIALYEKAKEVLDV